MNQTARVADHRMHNAFSANFGLIASLCLAATIATAAPPAKAAEYRIAARDAAIEKISAVYDAGNADDAARKAEEAASADLAAQLAGRTQSDIPNAANSVFVSAIANGRVYVAYGSIDPKAQVLGCMAIRTSYDKKAEQAEDDLRFEKIDRKVYDKLGNLRQKGEDEYKRCFTQRALKQPAFAEATRQAAKLLSAALNTR